MKIKIFIVIGVILLLMHPVRAEKDGIGLGIIAGEPTGLSIKKWIDVKSSVDGGLAWSFIDSTSFQIHADYLRHKYNITKEFNERLPLYYGIGGRIKFKESGKGNDDTKVGLRIPLGLTYLFIEEPVDIFFEIVPILNLIPETDLSINAAVGVRYYIL